jgi:alanyl-tRNA synthetase
MVSILARMHTAEHIFFKSLEKEISTLKLDKICLDEKESLLVVFADKLNWDILFKAEKKANEIIQEGRDVVEYIVDKSEVKNKFPGLRIKLERIKEDTVRVIEVKYYDQSACSGEHCSNTKEVGRFLVTRYNSAGPNKYEIRFKVDVVNDLYEFSKVARKTMEFLGTEIDKVENTLNNLKTNLEKYKKMARDVKVEAKEEKVGDVNFLYNVVEIESKQLMQQIGEMVKEKSVVCFINVGKNKQVMVAVSDDLDLDAGQIIKKVGEKFNGRGGGKKNFAMGSIETDKTEEVFDYVKELIR